MAEPSALARELGQRGGKGCGVERGVGRLEEERIDGLSEEGR